MSRHDFEIPVVFHHRVLFTRRAFAPDNRAVAELLLAGGGRKAVVVIEDAVAAAWPELAADIAVYFGGLKVALSGTYRFPGGEEVKADDSLTGQLWQCIDRHHLDRHSYVLAVGGGAFLDVAGFAAATAHRGVRLLRFPTTTLSQADSGVGVKCGINCFGKKNWVGSFAVPFAVVNDFDFLSSQTPEVNRTGLIEAVKVALVKDRSFFEWIEQHLDQLRALEPETVAACVERSALLHARHIATGGDPFETGSSRPLDFGHWAAHKLESLTKYALSHGAAVAVGLALDTLFSVECGMLAAATGRRVTAVLRGLGLGTYHPALDWKDAAGRRLVMAGLDEFREHLGGTLTVLLLRDIGVGENVHRIDPELMARCI
nr:3-dehydroquinate synthase [Akkermansiaceae bacterium]